MDGLPSGLSPPDGRPPRRSLTLIDDVSHLDCRAAVHASTKAAAALETRGSWFLFLPAYSPDLNPIEMAFSKLKAHLRAAGARTYEALWRAVGDICSLFEPRECWNFLRHSGYASD